MYKQKGKANTFSFPIKQYNIPIHRIPLNTGYPQISIKSEEISSYRNEFLITCTSDPMKHSKLKDDFQSRKDEHFVCDSCEYTTEKFYHLYLHIQTHKLELSCEMCNFKTTSNYSLENHLRNHSNENICKCDRCDFSTTEKYELCAHPDQPQEGFACKKCDYKTTTRENLKIHWLTHREPKFFCHLCPHRTHKTHNLKRHLATHKKIKQEYQCEFCEFKSIKKTVLNKHALIHKRKIYNCEVCGMMTNSKTKLCAHVKTHEMQTKFDCSLCGFIALDNPSLQIHKEEFHSDVDIKPSISEIETINKKVEQLISIKNEPIEGNAENLSNKVKIEPDSTEWEQSLVNSDERPLVREVKVEPPCNEDEYDLTKAELDLPLNKIKIEPQMTSDLMNIRISNSHSEILQNKCSKTNKSEEAEAAAIVNNLRCEKCDYSTSVKAYFEFHIKVHSISESRIA